MSESFQCWVIQAGVSTEASDTPKPEVLFLLTDAAATPSFQDSWYYAAEPGKNQMLAVALSAMSNQYQVHVFLNPNQGGNATQCDNMYLMAP